MKEVWMFFVQETHRDEPHGAVLQYFAKSWLDAYKAMWRYRGSDDDVISAVPTMCYVHDKDYEKLNWAYVPADDDMYRDEFKKLYKTLGIENGKA